MTNKMTPQRALLFRSPYPYGKSQIWLPTDLHKVGGKLDVAGIRTDVVDLNIEEFPNNLAEYNHIGIGVIGPPYVPGTITLAQEIRDLTGKKPLIGGPGVEHFSPEEFRKLYGDAIQITSDQDLSAALGIDVPSVYETSIADRIRNMDPSRLRKYLSKEFSIFVSQGCKFACDFCAAHRTRDGKKVTEKFSQVLTEDLEAICEGANKFGMRQLTAYLTPLDLFQNPQSFRESLDTIAEVSEKYGVSFHLRGLSRIDSFLHALVSEPRLYESVPRAGLKVVGFGVDGTAEEVWKSQHKGNKSLSYVDEAFQTCSKLGITPEALMVMGFHDGLGVPVDTKRSLQANVEYSISRAETMGVISRPHVAKDIVPGNNGWERAFWKPQRQKLLENPNPKLFMNLDFVALASEITHPNEEFRKYVNDAYLEIVKTLTPRGYCVTTPLIPYTGNVEKDKLAETFNMLVPSDI